VANGAAREAGTTPAPPTGADRLLAARLAAGDSDALSVAYRQLGPSVLGVSKRVLRDAALAEDVTQEVFTYLWEHPDRYDPTRGSLRNWVCLLAHRRSVDRVRAETRRTRNEARLDPGREDDAGSHGDHDERLAAEWMCGRVRRALACLPDEQRQVLEHAYFQGQTYRQVAATLSIPEGTAKSRIRLALGRLNQLLVADVAGEDAFAWT
jgi:RNA polymerase sigma-70 factor (ECF subfamily)